MACDYLGFSCTYKVQPQYDNVQDAINRAEFIANIKWQAASSITDASHAYYEGEIVRGLPYSSARELDCFVGIHVSFYTFLTATNNPRSLFYTEDISKPQYNASYLCSVYYGTVCSCAVEYALGMEVPYFTSMIDTQSVFTKPIDQNPENIDHLKKYLLPIAIVHAVLRIYYFIKGGKKEGIENNLWLTDGDVLRISISTTVQFNLYMLICAFINFLKEKIKILWQKKMKKSTI